MAGTMIPTRIRKAFVALKRVVDYGSTIRVTQDGVREHMSYCLLLVLTMEWCVDAEGLGCFTSKVGTESIL
jgi:hypothetical protein